MKTNQKNNLSDVKELKVSERKISFTSNNIKIAGILFYPEQNFSGTEALPAVVVGHPGGGVKEQTAGLYARLLAERGFITLTFDCAYQGESEGTPRNLEDPSQRVEDIKSAVSFLNSVPEVDSKRIGALGICASGGYILAAASTDKRIKAIATVSAADMGRQFRVGGDGKQDPGVLQYLLEVASNDRTEVAKGKEQGYMQIFPENAEQAKAMGQHVFEGYEYYCTERAQHPGSAKKFTWSSIDRIAAFNAFEFVYLISPRPILMIAGSEAITQWMSKEAMTIAKEPKELYLINGASHVDLYDKKEYVMPAVIKLYDYFVRTLNGK